MSKGGTAPESYLMQQKMEKAPGALYGTLARDMGNQGPTLDKPSGSAMNLTDNMKMNQTGKRGTINVFAPLRAEMKQ